MMTTLEDAFFSLLAVLLAFLVLFMCVGIGALLYGVLEGMLS